MTDDTGMLQHAIFSVPNSREGYTTDDNARALIVSTLLDESFDHMRTNRSIPTSLVATWRFSGLHSIPTRGRFRNFLGYDRKWLEKSWFGRQPWTRPVGAGNCAWAVAGCWIARSGRKAL